MSTLYYNSIQYILSTVKSRHNRNNYGSDEIQLLSPCLADMKDLFSFLSTHRCKQEVLVLDDEGDACCRPGGGGHSAPVSS